MERPPDSYALAWSNENGNVCMATLVFDDPKAAVQWAKAEHKSRGATNVRVDKTRTVVTANHGKMEATWTLVPVWNVPADYKGDVSVMHSHSLR